MKPKNIVVTISYPGRDPDGVPPGTQMREEGRKKRRFTDLSRRLLAKGKRYMGEFPSNLPLKRTQMTRVFPHRA